MIGQFNKVTKAVEQLPEFRCSKQSGAGREERMAFIISEVKQNYVHNCEKPDFLQ